MTQKEDSKLIGFENVDWAKISILLLLLQQLHTDRDSAQRLFAFQILPCDGDVGGPILQ